VGRLLGTPLRAAARSRRRAGRSLRGALIEERVELGGRELTLLRPPSADELIDEEAFDEDEFMPYWAELWPSGVALARVVAGLDLDGKRVLELGAGLGLPSLAAALRGADVLAIDWAGDAVALLRDNAARNGISLRAERVRWDEPEAILAEAPWDLVLGADVLYEQRNADRLLELLPRLGADILLADPGRPFAAAFLAQWDVDEVADRVYRLYPHEPLRGSRGPLEEW
jgi:predicted nicotinamide N-methyase